MLTIQLFLDKIKNILLISYASYSFHIFARNRIFKLLLSNKNLILLCKMSFFFYSMVLCNTKIKLILNSQKIQRNSNM